MGASDAVAGLTFLAEAVFGVYSLRTVQRGAFQEFHDQPQVTNSGKAALTAHFAGWKYVLTVIHNKDCRVCAPQPFRLAATRK